MSTYCTVGITVPTGHSLNLDGTAIYLTMASLFIAEAMDKPFSISQEVSLLVFLLIASKGAAGVTGAGLATLAGGLQSHRPDLVDAVGFNVGIDRMMSEARALTTFAGNAVATVLRGHRPSDEARMIDADPAAEPVVESEVVPAAATAPSSEAVRDRGSRPRPRGGVPLALVADPP